MMDCRVKPGNDERSSAALGAETKKPPLLMSSGGFEPLGVGAV
jgi:hypothetical protein